MFLPCDCDVQGVIRKKIFILYTLLHVHALVHFTPKKNHGSICKCRTIRKPVEMKAIRLIGPSPTTTVGTRQKNHEKNQHDGKCFCFFVWQQTSSRSETQHHEDTTTKPVKITELFVDEFVYILRSLKLSLPKFKAILHNIEFTNVVTKQFSVFLIN